MPTLYDIGADLVALDALLEEREGDVTDPIARVAEAASLGLPVSLTRAETEILAGDVGALRRLVASLADRVYKQSELLSRRAERRREG